MNRVSDYLKAEIEPKSGIILHQITSGEKPAIHRFYDTSPISPSGKYIALTEFPFEDRLPSPGENARVFVLDLSSGEEIYSSHTAAWDTQVGAHVQWGGDDGELFFNRMNDLTWTPYGVRVNIFSGNEFALDHTVYMVSSDGRYALSPCLRRICLVQPGYGAIVPPKYIPRNDHASECDGLYIVDTYSGKARLLVSLSKLVKQAKISKENENTPGAYYGFHAKWNSDSSRIMFIVRFLPRSAKIGKTRNYLLTFDANGDDIALALSAEEWDGGHHPNWAPDGKSIVMNLIYPRPSKFIAKASSLISKISKKFGLRYYPRSRRLSFVSIEQRGKELSVIAPNSVGSGHPTIDPSGKLLVTDAYPYEQVALRDGRVAIRGIHLKTGLERRLIVLNTEPKYNGPNGEYRIDPHPAWSRDGTKLTLNASIGGCRSVFVADVSSVLNGL